MPDPASSETAPTDPTTDTGGRAATSGSGARRPIRVLVGSPAAGLTPGTTPPSGTILLDLGDDHPSRAGLLELRIWADDGPDRRIERAEVVVGAMHRGAEKLYEVRDYRQILMLADRHDWQAPAAAELTIAIACEQLLGLEVPERAGWLRTLLAEHTRILSHLGFLGYLWPENSPTRSVREALRRQLQDLTGNRVHPMINRVGGLAADADPGWLARESEICGPVLDIADRAEELIMDGQLSARSARIPVLTERIVHGYGVTGPMARAAGVDLDLRRQQPYLKYAELAGLLAVTGGPERDGSPRARLWMLAAELRTSVELIRAVIDRLETVAGPVSVRLGKIIKLPEGDLYQATEAPLGRAGCYLVSRGEKTPWRLKLRTPSFNNVAALEALLPGCPVADLELVLASTGYVVGDIDR